MAIRYLSSDGEVVDYEYIKLACGQGPTLLAQQYLGNSPVDHTIAALLLDDVLTTNGQTEIRDILSVNPKQIEQLQDVINHLEQNIRDRQDSSGEYTLDILAHYAQGKPELFVDLIDDAAAYLSSDIGFSTPKNATRFLSQMVSVAPEQISRYQDQIEELKQHSDKQVQENCNTILNALNKGNDKSSGRENGVDKSLSDQPQDPQPPSQEQVNPDNRQSLDLLRKEAKEESVNDVPQKATTSHQVQQYNRSKKVKQYVKARADGQCEGCGDPAPFISKTGKPYLHAHHIHELSDGGADTVDTVIALCPNCHYRVHHGEDGDEYNKRLMRKMEGLESG